MTAKDIYHVARTDDYLRQAQEEADYWSKPHLFGPDAELGPVIERYFNHQFSGDGRVAWYAVLPRLGQFRRGCVLGLGGGRREARILQQNPDLHLTIYDISDEALAERQRALNKQFPGRVSAVTADLNFIEFPPESYDVVLSDSCLHHILNLEHLAHQVNRALTPGGYFFLRDYVGESRFRFSDEKKAQFEVMLDAARLRHSALRWWQPVWDIEGSSEQFSPFEAIRSEETLPVLRQHLSEISVSTVGAVISLVFWLRPVDDPLPAPALDVWGRFRRFLLRRLALYRGDQPGGIMDLLKVLGPDLIAADKSASGSGAILPNIAFAVYQKRGAS